MIETTIEFEHEGEFYSADIAAILYAENHGEDADGNRGMRMSGIDDIVIYRVQQRVGQVWCDVKSFGRLRGEIEKYANDILDLI